MRIRLTRKIAASGGKRGDSSAWRTAVRKSFRPAMNVTRLAGGHQVACHEPTLGDRRELSHWHSDRRSPVRPRPPARLLGRRRELGERRDHSEAGRQASVPAAASGNTSGGDPPFLGRSRRIGPTRALLHRPAALGVCGRDLDSRGGFPWPGRGRLQVVWRLQTDERDSLRLVGHMALRPALFSSRPWMPGCGRERGLRAPGATARVVPKLGRRNGCANSRRETVSGDGGGWRGRPPSGTSRSCRPREAKRTRSHRRRRT